MKNLFALIVLAVSLPVSAQIAAVNGFCEQGAQSAKVSGMNSTNKLQGITPGCLVTPYLTGTTTLATYYLTPTGSPQTGPFTADSTTGQYLFYASLGVGLDVNRSSGTTQTGVLTGSGSASGTVNAGTAGQIAYYPFNGAAVSGENVVAIAQGGTSATTAPQANLNIAGVTQTGTLGTSSQVSTFPGTIAATDANLGNIIIDASSPTYCPPSTAMGTCVKNALLALPSTGGTVDARNFIGAQTWNTDALSSVTASPARILLGSATLAISHTQTINSPYMSVEGNHETVISVADTTDDIFSVNSSYFTIEDLIFVPGSTKTAGSIFNVSGSFGLYKNLQIDSGFQGFTSRSIQSNNTFDNIRLLSSAGATWNYGWYFQGQNIDNLFTNIHANTAPVTDAWIHFNDRVSSSNLTNVWLGNSPNNSVGLKLTQSRPTITAISRSSNVVTATISAAFPSTDNVYEVLVSGVTDTTYNGAFIVSAASGTTITWSQTGATSSSSGGSLVSIFDRPELLNFSGLYIESGSSDDCAIITGAQGIKFTQSYFSGCLQGMVISGESTDIDISQSHFIANYEQGISTTAASVMGAGYATLHVEHNEFNANSNAANNTYDAILIGAGVSDFTIDHNRIGPNVFPTRGNEVRYGVNILAGASDRFMIEANDFLGVQTSSILNAGTGTNFTIFGNQPYYSLSTIDQTGSIYSHAPSGTNAFTASNGGFFSSYNAAKTVIYPLMWLDSLGNTNIEAGPSGVLYLANSSGAPQLSLSGTTAYVINDFANTHGIVIPSAALGYQGPAAGYAQYAPSATGTPGCLYDNGSGTRSWAACSGGGSGTVTTSGSPVSPNIAAFSSSTAITAATSANIQTAIGAGVYDASGAAAARQANLSLVAGTYADGKMCTYASSGTLLNCNTTIPAAQVAANLASSGSTGVTGQLPIGQVGSVGLSASNGVGIASTGAITLTYGTTANTAAQGNDSRITGAVQSGGALGTPSSGVITNLTGTCTSCTANSATSVPAANVASGALANGMTATTQSAGDNSTKLATTAYVATAVTYPVANTTFTTSTGSVGANTCNSTVQVAMTGVTTSMTFLITASADTSAATGWGSTGGLVLDVWPTAGYANYKICNQTAASITPTAVTFNIGAR